MPKLSALNPPQYDPSTIFEVYRGMFGSQLLTAAIAHFRVFEQFESGPLSFAALREKLGLELRPATVLVTGLRAFGLLLPADGVAFTHGHEGSFIPSPIALEHLRESSYFDISGYLGLAAQDPGVLAMVERLRTNRPAGLKQDEAGAAFIFRKDLASAMETESAARHLTLSLAGRAKNVAPSLAATVPLSNAQHLLDIGGGSGIYAIACLQKNPHLRATVLDRPEVLKVAAEFAQAYGVTDRLNLQPHDMWSDPFPAADVYLLSNILHDWDIPQCEQLLRRCSAAMPAGARLLIHDVFLNDSLDGPLPVALYGTHLFMLTEGRAYSAAEYRAMLQAASLNAGPDIIPSLIHCGVLTAYKIS
ncbi:methyltransferase [Pedosphaera parvula]|uniref:methyltransferase n=1 Tax=Pedosphaera parvula TaxID=1032527 RepID=UPI00030F4A24|nr:methyltransferase [Pedosphaera parvula]